MISPTAIHELDVGLYFNLMGFDNSNEAKIKNTNTIDRIIV